MCADSNEEEEKRKSNCSFHGKRFSIGGVFLQGAGCRVQVAG